MPQDHRGVAVVEIEVVVRVFVKDMTAVGVVYPDGVRKEEYRAARIPSRKVLAGLLRNVVGTLRALLILTLHLRRDLCQSLVSRRCDHLGFLLID
jgi:hypothetical protein